MSSPSSTLSSTAATSLPTTSSPNDDAPPGITRSSSLLFGFLVTFLALFVAFMACGLGSRRALTRRRRRMAALTGGGAGDGLNSLGMTGELRSTALMRKPLLWDVWIASGKECWKEMMPLSVKVLRKGLPSSVNPTDHNHESSNPQEHLSTRPSPPSGPISPDYLTYFASGRGIARVTATPPAFLGTSRTSSRRPSREPLSMAQGRSPLHTPSSSSPASRPQPSQSQSSSSFVQGLLQRSPLSRRKGSADEEGVLGKQSAPKYPVEGLQVSVLIAMPTPPRSRLKSDLQIEEIDQGGVQGEYALGIIDVPWHDETSGHCKEVQQTKCLSET